MRITRPIEAVGETVREAKRQAALAAERARYAALRNANNRMRKEIAKIWRRQRIHTSPVSFRDWVSLIQEIRLTRERIAQLERGIEPTSPRRQVVVILYDLD